jgi:hypothetical protein
LNDDLVNLEQAIDFLSAYAEEQFLKQDDLIGAAEAQILRSSGLRMMGQARRFRISRRGLDHGSLKPINE